MKKNESKKLYTLSQMGLQSHYDDAIMFYFNAKFQNPSAWYDLLKRISQVQKLRLAETWYQILYLVFL